MALSLLPNLLGETPEPRLHLTESVYRAVERLDGLIAESEKGARRFLALFGAKARSLPVALLNEHSKERDIEELLQRIESGEWGLISDAGLPSLADPGADLVLRARERGIEIRAYMGPSAILLALLLSGFPANRFAFHGYLPIEERERKRALLTLEMRSQKEAATQVFIETPYRNAKLLEMILATLDVKTWFAVGWDLTLPTERFLLGRIARWKECGWRIEKAPATFLIYSEMNGQHEGRKI